MTKKHFIAIAKLLKNQRLGIHQLTNSENYQVGNNIITHVDNGLIDYRILYGSWAGAFGNFQFMPSTNKNYAIDYDNNNIIELKKSNERN